MLKVSYFFPLTYIIYEERGGMVQLYTINTKYIEELRKIEPKIRFNKDLVHTRPYIGTVIVIDKLKYFAPLSSCKGSNHKSNDVTVMINVEKDGSIIEIAAVKLNNMIPVVPCVINIIDTVALSKTDPEYSALLSKELHRINSSLKVEIGRKAHKMLQLLKSDREYKLSSVCNNFKLLEKYVKDNYLEKNDISELSDDQVLGKLMGGENIRSVSKEAELER